VEKFNRGYIKHNGEPAEEIVDSAVGTAVMKLGTIGVQVKIIPPNAELPDDFEVYEDVEVEDYVADTDGESVEELLEEEPTETDETDADEPSTDEPATDDAAEEFEEVEEVADEESDADADETPETADAEDAVEEELDEETAEEAAELMDEMEADDEEGDAE
jgi:small subunit ribosomal protein S3